MYRMLSAFTLYANNYITVNTEGVANKNAIFSKIPCNISQNYFVRKWHYFSRM